MRDWTAIAGRGALDQRRFAVERGKTAEAALEPAHDKLRDATAYPLGSVDKAGCGGRWAERVHELARLRLAGAALQCFRERLPWLGARVEREISGPRAWPELGGEALYFISLLICRCQHQEGV
jgi:hypothetical protein